MNDIVYFLREGKNEELRYSLRSVVKNFPHSRVIFYGGKPKGITPDVYVKVEQNEPTKWQKVRHMMLLACENDDISDEFWLFNDDFFVMKKVETPPTAIYNGTLAGRIAQIEKATFGRPSEYSKLLRRLKEELQAHGIEKPLNYATHTPMLINRKKMAEVLRGGYKSPMFRALYGNLCHIGGIDEPDVKYHGIRKPQNSDTIYVSTSDESWNRDEIGHRIRAYFQERSRFEE